MITLNFGMLFRGAGRLGMWATIFLAALCHALYQFGPRPDSLHSLMLASPLSLICGFIAACPQILSCLNPHRSLDQGTLFTRLISPEFLVGIPLVTPKGRAP